MGEAPESSKITLNVFKEHFERVSKERYEWNLSAITRLIERLKDLGVDHEKARNAIKMLNEMPLRKGG